MKPPRSSTPPLADNITRRRFLKRTGVASVATVFGVSAFRSGLLADPAACKCVSVFGPATFTLDGNTNAASLSGVPGTPPVTTPTGGHNGGQEPDDCPASWKSRDIKSTEGGPTKKNVPSDKDWLTGGTTEYTLTAGQSVRVCGLN